MLLHPIPETKNMNNNGMGPNNKGPKTGRGLGNYQREDILNTLNYDVSNESFSITMDNNTSGDLLLNDNYIGDIIEDDKTSCWQWWQNYYYPQVIRESYPVYIQEKAKDKGKQAYEIIKVLRDKELIEINKVKDFMKLMDELIKLL